VCLHLGKPLQATNIFPLSLAILTYSLLWLHYGQVINWVLSL
jgi:hypothetical protein